MNTILDYKVQNLLENVNLDTVLTGTETLELLKDCPKLKARARTYFFHQKKVVRKIAQLVYPKVYFQILLKGLTTFLVQYQTPIMKVIMPQYIPEYTRIYSIGRIYALPTYHCVRKTWNSL